MQKKLIALAIAGLSSAAFAQSNVTIYGVMDATYDNVSATGGSSNVSSKFGAATPADLPSRGRTTFNSSYIGFKGVESLGNGLAVAFQIETGIGESGQGSFGGTAAGGSTALATSGNNTWATRDTYVGLAGGFGTVAFGNLTGPTRGLGAAMDVNSGATGIGANTALLGKLGAGSGAGAFDQRIANAIAYISPTFSGFSGVIGYMPNENRGVQVASGAAPKVNVSAWTFGATYANGPIYAALAYTTVKDSNSNNFGSGFTYIQPSFAALGAAGTLQLDNVNNTRAAFKYDFGMATVGIMWDRTKAGVNTANALNGGDISQTVWFIPVTFTIGNGKIIGQYGKANNLNIGGTLGTTVAGATAANGGTDFTAKMFTLGYEYSLSKRTTAKVLYSQINNSKDASYDFLYGVSNNNTTGNLAASVAPGSDPRGLSIGIRHSF